MSASDPLQTLPRHGGLKVTPSEFGAALQLLDPSNDDFDAAVENLIGRVDLSVRHELIDRIFDFFEAHPVEDLGSPGALVHFVERFYPEYKGRLLFSLRRSPSLSAVWMTNRILNTKLERLERAVYLAALEGVAESQVADAEVRDFAEQFAAHQRGEAEKGSRS